MNTEKKILSHSVAYTPLALSRHIERLSNKLVALALAEEYVSDYDDNNAKVLLDNILKDKHNHKTLRNVIDALFWGLVVGIVTIVFSPFVLLGCMLVDSWNAWGNDWKWTGRFKESFSNCFNTSKALITRIW